MVNIIDQYLLKGYIDCLVELQTLAAYSCILLIILAIYGLLKTSLFSVYKIIFVEPELESIYVYIYIYRLNNYHLSATGGTAPEWVELLRHVKIKHGMVDLVLMEFVPYLLVSTTSHTPYLTDFLLGLYLLSCQILILVFEPVIEWTMSAFCNVHLYYIMQIHKSILFLEMNDRLFF